MKAGRELDVKVAKIMGLDMSLMSCPQCEDNGVWQVEVPRYSADIADAWKVVEWMGLQGWHVHIDLEDNKWRCGLDKQQRRIEAVSSNTAPEAICNAVVEASKEQQYGRIYKN